MNWLTVLCTLLLNGFAVTAGASPLFEEDEPLKFTLDGPISTLITTDDKTVQYPFLLTTATSRHKVKVRVRGKSRRRICQFPPLRLNFSSEDTAGTAFSGQDKLKLVWPCRKGPTSQLDVLEEFAAYRMLNELTAISYRVRLVQISFAPDSEADGALLTRRTGFVIESQETLAARVGGKSVETAGVVLAHFNTVHAATVFIFQYMIGNTDWSLVTANEDDTCCHNGDILDVAAERYYVPYDFDQAGLVNARYAVPDPSLGLSRVTKRRYRGHCLPEAALYAALSQFSERREQMLTSLSKPSGLSGKDLTRKHKYLATFFSAAGKPERLVRLFKKACL